MTSASCNTPSTRTSSEMVASSPGSMTRAATLATSMPMAAATEDTSRSRPGRLRPTTRMPCTECVGVALAGSSESCSVWRGRPPAMRTKSITWQSPSPTAFSKSSRRS